MRETLRQTRQDAANMEDQIEVLASQNAVLTRLLADCLGVSEAADLVEVAECVIHARGEGAGPLENTVLELRKARRVIETITKTLCNI